MDDLGQQRLLDVINDNHALESFLRENFPSSSGLDSPRLDTLNSSTNSASTFQSCGNNGYSTPSSSAAGGVGPSAGDGRVTNNGNNSSMANSGGSSNAVVGISDSSFENLVFDGSGGQLTAATVRTSTSNSNLHHHHHHHQQQLHGTTTYNSNGGGGGSGIFHNLPSLNCSGADLSVTLSESLSPSYASLTSSTLPPGTSATEINGDKNKGGLLIGSAGGMAPSSDNINSTNDGTATTLHQFLATSALQQPSTMTQFVIDGSSGPITCSSTAAAVSVAGTNNNSGSNKNTSVSQQQTCGNITLNSIQHSSHIPATQHQQQTLQSSNISFSSMRPGAMHSSTAVSSTSANNFTSQHSAKILNNTKVSCNINNSISSNSNKVLIQQSNSSTVNTSTVANLQGFTSTLSSFTTASATPSSCQNNIPTLNITGGNSTFTSSATPNTINIISSVGNMTPLPPGVQLLNAQGQIVSATSVSSSIPSSIPSSSVTPSQQSQQQYQQPQHILSLSSANNQLLASTPLVQTGQLFQGATQLALNQSVNGTPQVIAPSLLGGVHASSAAAFMTNNSVVQQGQLHIQSIAQQQQQQVIATSSKANNVSFRTTSQAAAPSCKSPGQSMKATSSSSSNCIQQQVSSTTMQAASPNVMLQQMPTMMGGSVVLSNTQHQNALKSIMPATGQLIQLLSTNNRIPVVSTPKLIQPKQPQLLPKPMTGATPTVVASSSQLVNKNMSSGGPSRSISSTPPCSSSAALTSAVAQTHTPTLMALAGSNQATVLGAAANAAAGATITSTGGAGTAAPGLILNAAGLLQSANLQTGLHSPILVQHPSGLQLLVKPANAASTPFLINSTPFLVNAPAAQAGAAGNKTNAPTAATVHPQAILVPGANGQPPTFVMPSNLTQNFTAASAQSLPTQASNLVGATSANPRNIAPTQGPIYRIIPQQPAGLTLQQINTPNGPSYIAVPSNNAPLHLPTGTVLGSAVRPLGTAPQLQTPTIQIAAGPSQQLQVPGQPALQLAPTMLNAASGIPIVSSSTAAASVIANVNQKSAAGILDAAGNNNISNTSGAVAVSGTGDATNIIVSQAVSSSNSASFTTTSYQQQQPRQQQQSQEQKKKKSKKKKKETKESPKRGSINLSDILKETGILGDLYSGDHDLGSLIVEDDGHLLGGGSMAPLQPDTVGTSIASNNSYSTQPSDLDAITVATSYSSNPTVSFSVMPMSASSSSSSISNCSSIASTASTLSAAPNVILSSNLNAAVSSIAAPPLSSHQMGGVGNSGITTFLSMPSTIFPSIGNSVVSHSALTTTTASSALSNSGVIQSNLLNLGGSGTGLTPQLLGAKVSGGTGSALPQGVVATVDAQGKLVFGNINSLKPQIIASSTAGSAVFPTANGLVMSFPTMQVVSSDGSTVPNATFNSLGQMILNTSQHQTPTVIFSTTAAGSSNSAITVTSQSTQQPQLAPFILSNSTSQQPQIIPNSSCISTSTFNAGTTALSPRGSKKIGAELTKVVQNTQLFKSLQPDTSSSSSMKLNNVCSSSSVTTNINTSLGSIAQDGVIIGCHSFKPTSTGYGINKPHIVPVNSIVNSCSVASNSYNMLSAAPVVSSTAFQVNNNGVNMLTPSATTSNVLSASMNNTVKISIDNNSFSSYNNINNQIIKPVIATTAAAAPTTSKSKRNSRSKKKSKFEDEFVSAHQQAATAVVVSTPHSSVDLSPVAVNSVGVLRVSATNNGQEYMSSSAGGASTVIGVARKDIVMNQLVSSPPPSVTAATTQAPTKFTSPTVTYLTNNGINIPGGVSNVYETPNKALLPPTVTPTNRSPSLIDIKTSNSSCSILPQSSPASAAVAGVYGSLNSSASLTTNGPPPPLPSQPSSSAPAALTPIIVSTTTPGASNNKTIKQVVLTQANQDMFMKVISELQVLTSKKELTEQERLEHDRLCAESKRILETGKPFEVSSLHNKSPLLANANSGFTNSTITTTSNNITPSPAVRYSHPVGHKIITLNPKTKNQISSSHREIIAKEPRAILPNRKDSSGLSINSCIGSTSFSSTAATITSIAGGKSLLNSHLKISSSNSNNSGGLAMIFPSTGAAADDNNKRVSSADSSNKSVAPAVLTPFTVTSSHCTGGSIGGSTSSGGNYTSNVAACSSAVVTPPYTPSPNGVTTTSTCNYSSGTYNSTGACAPASIIPIHCNTPSSGGLSSTVPNTSSAGAFGGANYLLQGSDKMGNSIGITSDTISSQNNTCQQQQGVSITSYNVARTNSNLITPPPSNSPSACATSCTPPSSLPLSSYSNGVVSLAGSQQQALQINVEPSNSSMASSNQQQPPHHLSLPNIITNNNSSSNKNLLNVGLPQTSPITPTSPVPPMTFGAQIQNQPVQQHHQQMHHVNNLMPQPVGFGQSSPSLAGHVQVNAAPQNPNTSFVASSPRPSLPANGTTPPFVSPVAGPAASVAQTSSPAAGTFVPRPTTSPVSYPHSMSFTQDKLFELQLRTDQKGALNPDYKSPFKGKLDACKRLIRYHVFSDRGPTPRDLEQADVQFEAQSEALQRKSKAMLYKCQSLLLRDSQRRHATAEVVMLYRMHLQEERLKFEKEKNLVESGRAQELNIMLPPNPNPNTSSESLYPWEDNWQNEKLYTFSPQRFDDETKEEDIKEELEDDTPELLFRNMKSSSPCATNSGTSRDEVNTPSGNSLAREELNTPYGNNLNRYDTDSPSTDKPASRPSSQLDNKKDLNFTERFKKTQKMQEDLYDKLLANSHLMERPASSLSKESGKSDHKYLNPVVELEKIKSPCKTDNWDEDEEALDDPPALQIMEESEPELEPFTEPDGPKDDEACASPDLSPERLRDDRGFARRDSIVYRRSSSDESDDSVGSTSPELRVVTTAEPTVKNIDNAEVAFVPSKKSKDNNRIQPCVSNSSEPMPEVVTDNTLEDRFNTLCKENGLDEYGKRVYSDDECKVVQVGALHHRRSPKYIRTDAGAAVPSHLLVQQPTHTFTSSRTNDILEDVNNKNNKSTKSTKEQKKLKIKIKSDKNSYHSSASSSETVAPCEVEPASTKVKTDEKRTGRITLTLKKQSTGDYKPDEEKSQRYVVTKNSSRNSTLLMDKPTMNFNCGGGSSHSYFIPEENNSKSSSKNKRRDGTCDDRDRKKSKKDKSSRSSSDKYLSSSRTAEAIATDAFSTAALMHHSHYATAAAVAAAANQHHKAAAGLKYNKNSDWFSGSNLYHHHSQPPLVTHPALHLPTPLHPTAGVAPAAAAAVAAAMQHRTSSLQPPGPLLNHHLREGSSYPSALPSIAPYHSQNQAAGLYQPRGSHHSYY